MAYRNMAYRGAGRPLPTRNVLDALHLALGTRRSGMPMGHANEASFRKTAMGFALSAFLETSALDRNPKLRSDGIRNGIRVIAHGSLRLRLDHHAGQRLRAGIADNHAPVPVQSILSGADG